MLWFPAHWQKNKTTQEIPLCPWMEQLLHEVEESKRTGWVFEPQSLQQKVGRRYFAVRLTAERVGKVLSEIGKTAGVIVDEGNPRTGAGVKYASCHDLRRTFAVRLYDADMPPELLRKLLRHADLRTTERYYLTEQTQEDAGWIRTLLRATNEPQDHPRSSQSVHHSSLQR